MDGSESCWSIFLEYVELITRVWGVFAAIVLVGVGADLCLIHQLAGGFAIAAAFITLFLETTWALTIVLQICVRYEHHPIHSCWNAVSYFDYWKRTVIYTILAVLLFAQPHRAWFSTVGGLILIILGLLHTARWYRELKNVPVSLLEQQDDGLNDDNVEIDVSLPEPLEHLENYSTSHQTQQQRNLDDEFILRVVA